MIFYEEDLRLTHTTETINLFMVEGEKKNKTTLCNLITILHILMHIDLR